MDLASATVAVYCSSSDHVAAGFKRAAAELGATLALRRATIVYGGGSTGLMGVLADAALGRGGRVVGVIPRQLVEREVAHRGLSEQHVVETMHERKMLMSQRAAAFVVLPGGFGTLEEFFEVVSWRTLGIHEKPILVLNAEGYFDPMLEQIHRGVGEQMIRPAYAAFVQIARDVREAIALLESDPVPSARVERWT